MKPNKYSRSQFDDSTKQQIVAIIAACINDLNNKKPIEIDNDVINDFNSFSEWLDNYSNLKTHN